MEGLFGASMLGRQRCLSGAGVHGTTAGCESMGWESPSAKEVISRPTYLQGRGVQPNTFSPRMLPGHAAQSSPREVCALSLHL